MPEVVSTVIVDYGMGNLRSVEKGFQKVGIDAKIVSDPQSIDDAPAIVLPGVGSFRDCMRNLEKISLIEPVVRSIKKRKPYLGICLGLQVLFSKSEEFGTCDGLDIFKGKVVRFQVDLKVPHMGGRPVLTFPPELARMYVRPARCGNGTAQAHVVQIR